MQISEAQSGQLMAYLDLLEKWNKTYNLTAVRQRDDMLVQHILDSLAIEPYLESGWSADMGTGAGLPGVPLAIARPDTQWYLLDSNGKKIRFLRQVKRVLNLDNIHPVESRVEAFKPDQALVQLTARALAKIDQLLIWAQSCMTDRGRLLAMKAVKEVDSDSHIRVPGWCFAEGQPLDIPGLDANRHVLIYQRCVD